MTAAIQNEMAGQRDPILTLPCRQAHPPTPSILLWQPLQHCAVILQQRKRRNLLPHNMFASAQRVEPFYMFKRSLQSLARYH